MRRVKLVGSKTEQDFKQQLIKSNKLLFDDEEYKNLLKVLYEYFPNMRTAYIIHWIPEQGEDIYRLLIDDSLIAEIALDRINLEVKPLVESALISQYRQGLTKINQIKLLVALDLAKKDLESTK